MQGMQGMQGVQGVQGVQGGRTGGDRVVQNDDLTLETEGGPYADASIVVLPDIEHARTAIFAVANAEARREGFAGASDRGQPHLFLWWD